MQVVERKQDNSGIPQGTLIRRHRFPGPNGGYLSSFDLCVGEDLCIYGRTIRLNDCDEFTDNFYKAQGLEQPEPEKPEQGCFELAKSRTHRVRFLFTVAFFFVFLCGLFSILSW